MNNKSYFDILNNSDDYGINKRVLLQYGLCDNCNEEQNVICFDSSDNCKNCDTKNEICFNSSDNEYGIVKICQKCVLDYFDKFEDEPNNKICRSCDNICEITDFVKIKQTRKYSLTEVCKKCCRYFGVERIESN